MKRISESIGKRLFYTKPNDFLITVLIIGIIFSSCALILNDFRFIITNITFTLMYLIFDISSKMAISNHKFPIVSSSEWDFGRK